MGNGPHLSCCGHRLNRMCELLRVIFDIVAACDHIPFLQANFCRTFYHLTLIYVCDNREPTTLESLSRAIRNYVPNSISIPTVSPTSSIASRPISMGGIAGHPQGTTVSRASSNQSDASRRDVADLDNDLLGISPQSSHSPGNGLTTYPGSGTEEGDQIIWSGWDSLGSGSTLQ